MTDQPSRTDPIEVRVITRRTGGWCYWCGHGESCSYCLEEARIILARQDQLSWMDLELYPGPSGHPLPWDDPDADPLGDLKSFASALGQGYSQIFISMGRQASKIIEGLKPIMEIEDELNQEPDLPPVTIITAKGKNRQPLPRHVGPRSGQQFDKRGRRRY